MTGRTDYTDDQWKLVIQGPTAAGMHVIESDRGGSVRESFSMAHAYSEERKKHGESQLLDEVVNTRPTIDKTGGTPEELAERNLKHVRDAVAIVKQKGDKQELADYKNFIVSVAKHTAEARKEGFLGITGELVSDKEQAAIDQITAALG